MELTNDKTLLSNFLSLLAQEYPLDRYYFSEHGTQTMVNILKGNTFEKWTARHKEYAYFGGK